MRKWRLFSVLLVLSLLLASCNLPVRSNDQTVSVMQTQIALNVALTQVAGTLTAMAQPATQPAQPTATLTAAPLEQPTNTLTPEPSLTPTEGGVWLTLNENTNCRSGPGSMYELLATIKKGESVQASARNPYDDYFYVRYPTPYNEYCWLWSRYSTVSGELNILPVFTPQPTPTPAVTPTATTAPVDFTVSYLNTQTDSGMYFIQFFVKNTGGLVWQSIVVSMKDNANSRNFIFESDLFRGIDGGVLDTGNTQNDLATGESSRVAVIGMSGAMDYNPAGHSFTATITMYSKDGRTGTPLSKTITFVP